MVCAVGALATAAVLSSGPGSPGAAALRPEHAVHAPAPRAAPTADLAPGERPNILLVTVDDMRSDDLPYLTAVNRLLVDRGTTMTNAVATTPLCVPSRASLLSGQYAHNHRARTVNRVSEPPGGWSAFGDRNTLPVWLGRVGYDRMFVGKYLNRYGQHSSDRYVPPGWTRWLGSLDPATYRYQRVRLNIDGRVRSFDRYNTYVFADQTDRLLSQDRRTRRPWYLWVNYVAPHNGGPRDPDDPRATHPGNDKDLGTPSPAPVDRDSFAAFPIPDKPSLFEDTSDKALPAAHATWDPVDRALLTELWQQRVESLQAVDRAVAGHLRVLERTGQLDRTLVVFMSDNGYLVGEHNTEGKLWHYRESLEVPVVVRGPGVPEGAEADTLITTTDLPVAFAALAGAVPGREVDGADVSGYWEEPSAAQRVVPIELFLRQRSGAIKAFYRGVRVGDRYTYVRLRTGQQELFDLHADPYELTNVAGDPAYAEVVAQLRQLTAEWRDCHGATCPQGEVTVLPDGTIELEP